MHGGAEPLAERSHPGLDQVHRHLGPAEYGLEHEKQHHRQHHGACDRMQDDRIEPSERCKTPGHAIADLIENAAHLELSCLDLRGASGWWIEPTRAPVEALAIDGLEQLTLAAGPDCHCLYHRNT